VRRLGASRAAVLGSLTPAFAALLGIPLLGELPTQVTWVAIVAVSLGVILAGGAFSRAGKTPRLPHRPARNRS